MKRRALAAIGLGLTMAFAPVLRAQNVDEKFVADHPIHQVSKEVLSLTKRATNGNPKAQFELARMYEKGRGGLHRDMGYAVSWYEESARSGNKEARKRLRALGSVN